MYYRLRQTPVHSGLYDVIAPSLGLQVRWLSGQPHGVPIQTPIEVTLDDEFGTRLADIFTSGILLMSNRLVAALRKAGVSNIDTYEAILVDPKRSKRFPGYQAVQILGRVQAADMNASKAHDPLGVGHTMVAFTKLVIDETAAKGVLMFRLLETASTIIIHEQVKAELDKTSWDFVTVCRPDEEPTPLDPDGTWRNPDLD